MANASSQSDFFVRPPEPGALNVALVAGPMYDPLYELLPDFEAKTGRRVHVAARLVHPELNAHLEEVYRSGQGAYDLVSTHNKYAPSQKHFLRPLDDWFLETELSEFIPSVLEMSRVEGWLLSVPRNIDVRLLYYRRDLFEDPSEQEKYRALTGLELHVPGTWKSSRRSRSFSRARRSSMASPFPAATAGCPELSSNWSPWRAASCSVPTCGPPSWTRPDDGRWDFSAASIPKIASPLRNSR